MINEVAVMDVIANQLGVRRKFVEANKDQMVITPMQVIRIAEELLVNAGAIEEVKKKKPSAESVLSLVLEALGVGESAYSHGSRDRDRCIIPRMYAVLILHEELNFFLSDISNSFEQKDRFRHTKSRYKYLIENDREHKARYNFVKDYVLGRI